jgi:endonuclease/exonuclease/phosphatase family metal-dependent hydrolase
MAWTAAVTLGSAPMLRGQPLVAGLLSHAQLPVVTWNIRVGQTDTSARQAMDFVAALKPLPRVVVLNEASFALFSSYESELTIKTGEAWTGVFQRHCALNNWSGSACTRYDDEGVAILTSLPVLFTEGRVFPYADCWHSGRAAAHATVQLGRALVEIFTTHLQTGGCADDSQSRLHSIASLKAWASGFPATPHLIGGDFNALPTSPEISDPSQGMMSAFADAWLQAGQGNGYTYDSSTPFKRIDYWFLDLHGQAMTKTIGVPASTLSDHLPVRATFENVPRITVLPLGSFSSVGSPSVF